MNLNSQSVISEQTNMQNVSDYQLPDNYVSYNQLHIINNQLLPDMAQMTVAPSTTAPSTELITTLQYQQPVSSQQMVSIPGIATTIPSDCSFDSQSAFPVVVDNISFCEGQQICESTNIIFDVVNTSADMPVLEITRQPSSRPHRFRYRSEMHGTHGCLTAEDSTSKKKTYPTVVLKNLTTDAHVKILCSLYQVNDHSGVKVQHSHKLVIKKENQDEDSDPHIKVPTKKSPNMHEAVFSDMGIIHTKREDIKNELRDKMVREKLWQLQVDHLPEPTMNEIEKKAVEYSKDMNLNQVCLCFEAFVWNETQWLRICEPVFSNTINNMKSSQVGELKICRMSKCQSPATGGEEVFLFVEKVSRDNIKVLFTERGKSDGAQWEAEGIFNANSDVHRQYGIVFKTPAFKDRDIRSAVDVKIQLLRPTDNAVSEPLTFHYVPVLKRKLEREDDLIPETVLSHEKRYRTNMETRNGTSSNSSESDYYFENPGSACSNVPTESSDISMDQVSYQCSATVFESWDVFDRKDLRLFEAAFNEVYDEFGIEYDASAIENTALANIKETIEMLSKDKANNFVVIRESLKNYLNFQLYNGINILLDCISEGSIGDIQDIISILRKYKLNFMFNSTNRNGRNCLHLLALKGDRVLLDLFTKIKVDVNAVDNEGNTPLHCAVMGESNQTTIVESLLQNCENIKLDVINNSGCTPLHLAALNGKLSIMRILIEAGADPGVQNLLTGNNVLHLLAENEKEHGEILKMIIKNRSDLVHEQNYDSIDFIAACIRNKRKRLIKVLESNGISTDESIDEETLQSDEILISNALNQTTHRNPTSLLGTSYAEICEILDRNEKWESLCRVMNLNEKIAEWKNSDSSATGNFLNFILNNGKELSEIALICETMGEFEASEAIDRAVMEQMTK